MTALKSFSIGLETLDKIVPGWKQRMFCINDNVGKFDILELLNVNETLTLLQDQMKNLVSTNQLLTTEVIIFKMELSNQNNQGIVSENTLKGLFKELQGSKESFLQHKRSSQQNISTIKSELIDKSSLVYSTEMVCIILLLAILHPKQKLQLKIQNLKLNQRKISPAR